MTVHDRTRLIGRLRHFQSKFSTKADPMRRLPRLSGRTAHGRADEQAQASSISP
jgi:hypothetical protein